jgi:hypothetical protein
MKKNMGNLDRMIRLLVTAVIVVLYLLNVITGTLAIILLILAAVFLVTSILSFCPLYYLFNIRTSKKE